jgi:CheY-like chemotaxis protein
MADPAFEAPARKPRFLMINDVPDVCTLIEAFYSFAFDVDFECVESSVEALVRLLAQAYDLLLMDCIHPVGPYALLPPEVATRYQAIPSQVQVAGRPKRYSEGERLFRFLRSPLVADLGWKTDVGCVPVIFYTAGPRLLDKSAILAMGPVVVMGAPSQLEALVGVTQRLLGRGDAGRGDVGQRNY